MTDNEQFEAEVKKYLKKQTNPVVKIKLLDPRAEIPRYETEGSAGFDLKTLDSETILPFETKLIKTGISMEIPIGWELQIRPRSGTSLKTKLRVANSPGTIDCIPLNANILIGENGEECELSDILKGEVKEVMSYNFKDEIIEKQPINEVFQVGEKEIYNIELSNGRNLRVTDNELIYTTRGWVKCKDLNLNDEVIGID